MFYFNVCLRDVLVNMLVAVQFNSWKERLACDEGIALISCLLLVSSSGPLFSFNKALHSVSKLILIVRRLSWRKLTLHYRNSHMLKQVLLLLEDPLFLTWHYSNGLRVSSCLVPEGLTSFQFRDKCLTLLISSVLIRACHKYCQHLHWACSKLQCEVSEWMLGMVLAGNSTPSLLNLHKFKKLNYFTEAVLLFFKDDI